MMARLTQYFALAAVAFANLLLVSFPESAHAEDTDIFTVNPNITSLRPNVLIIQDNSANWDQPFTAEKAALVSTVQGLDDRFNVGLMSFVETSVGKGNTNVDGSYVRAAVRQMTTANKTALANLVNAFDIGDDKSNNAIYGLTMAEAYRYFGGLNATTGQVKRDAAGNSVSGFSSAAASNAVFARPGNAFTSMASNTYVSPIADNCAKNFIIFISNGKANDNASATSTATSALQGYRGSTAEIALSPNGAQSNVADEWARFMANSDVNANLAQPQNVYTFTVDVNPGSTNLDLAHTALLKSMALQGKGKYFAVTSNSADIADALNKIFQEVLATNSVFASAALPASVSTRGTFLNQVYMGVFRPDGQASPRWTGNLKQFAVALNSAGNLELVDRFGNAVAQPNGFLKSTITSYWTTSSSFWDAAYYPDVQGTSTTPTSDAPDGNLVEKGGAAYRLRSIHATDVTTRKLYTCTGACAAGSTLSTYQFNTTNAALTAAAFGLSTAVTAISQITWSEATGSAVATATATAHGFSTGQSVTITGANQTQYNGLKTITVVDANTFTFPLTVTPATPDSGTTITLSRPGTSVAVTSMSRSGSTGFSDTVTVTAPSHGFNSGDTVTVTGATGTSTGYNVSAVITRIDANTFQFPITIAPPSGGTSGKAGNKNISLIGRSGTTITVTTSNNHGFSVGSTVAISNVSVADGGNYYNNTGTQKWTVVSAPPATPTVFTFNLTEFSALSPPITATGTILVSRATATFPVTGITRSGTTATALATSTGLSVGSPFSVSGANGSAYNGSFTASAANSTSVSYPVTLSPVSPATGSITATITGTTDKDELIRWVRGENRQLDDNPSVALAANTYVRGYLHGDVVHSRPAIINYNRSGQPANRDLAVFYGSNDGIFHAVKGGQNDADGSELWGFVMPEFFSKLGRQYSAAPVINNASSTTAKPYFADGPISTLLIDANNDGAIVSSTPGDKAYLYIGMRRGGRQLYALDVTAPTSPKLLWKIDGSTTGVFSELGQTWAEAKVGKIAGYANSVLIMSAGYDAVANDAATQGTATMGRGVYIIDAISGAPLWYAGPAAISGVTSTVVPGMTYAIPAAASPIDSDGDGYIDRIYLADTGGNLWRANIGALTSGGTPVGTWPVSKIANLGGSGSSARKFLNAPDVVGFNGPPTTIDSILIGSGDREQPFDVAIQNRFYMVKDSHALTALPSAAATETDLCDLTSDAIQGSDATAAAISTTCLNDAAKLGWFITLGTGEKVVTNSVTVNNTTVFGTNVPESTLDHTNSCSSGLGEARLYTINFKDATSVVDQQPNGLLGLNDRFAVNTGGGLPPSPVLISTEINGRLYEGIGSGPSIIIPPGVPVGRRTRVYWNIRNEVN